MALVTLGCARNETDSEELAGRLSTAGWRVVRDPARADAVVVNTCAFIEAAKQESVDTVLAAADAAAGSGRRVVATGCLAERYGATLARALPEADAVIGFDDYPRIAERLAGVLDGEHPAVHSPRDRRLLPIAEPAGPTPILSSTPAPRRRLRDGPVAPLKLASGCDRRCTFCAIPSFRGRFVSRPPEELLTEAAWLAAHGARELLLVSENTTSYGKDLGDVRLLERLLPLFAAVPGIVRVRLSYLQPAELRPSLIEAIATTPGVAAYFDVSFQHASPPVLRAMRRFGGSERFLDLLARIRGLAPQAGIRANVLVGFPGERRADVATLCRFLGAARLDAVGVFGYSDEDGTAATRLPGKVPAPARARRVERVRRLVDELGAQRAEERIGETVEILVEAVRGRRAQGRAAHQGAADGATTVRLPAGHAVRVGDLLTARVAGSDGVDLRAEPVGTGSDGPVAAGRAAAG